MAIPKIRSLVLTLVLLSVVSLPTVFAVKGVRSLPSTTARRLLKGDKHPKKRDCKVSENSEKIEFKCKAKTESPDDDTEIKDEIKFKFQTNDKKNKGDLRIKVEYHAEFVSDDDEFESDTQYEIVFDRLLEYRKAGSDDNSTESSSSDDEDQAYDWENDEIVKESSFADNWGEFTKIENDKDSVVSTFSVATLDDVVQLSFSVSRAAVGEVLTANKMKIDFELVGYEWAASDTYAALICKVESKQKVKVEYEEGEETPKASKKSKKTRDVLISFDDALDSTGVMPFGEYTWATTAMVMETNTTMDANATANIFGNETEVMETSSDTTNNTEISVVATSPLDSTDGNSMIAFSFIGDAARSASDIYWDPEAGIGYSGAASTSLMVGTVLASLVAMLLA